MQFIKKFGKKIDKIIILNQCFGILFASEIALY